MSACGCGRVARNLINEPLCSYTGFDRHRGMIDWCKREIEPRAPHFSFFYFDLRSCYQSIDKQSGTIAAGSFQFPFDDNCFDVAFLSSVFTHMPLDEVRHYLHELSRVLANGGKVLFSVFFTKQARFVDSINYHHNPEEVRDAVVSRGPAAQLDDFDAPADWEQAGVRPLPAELVNGEQAMTVTPGRSIPRTPWVTVHR